MVTYPNERFDGLSLLLQTIPSFWQDIYDGRELVSDYLRGSLLEERQVDQTAQELFDSINRQDCPVFHNWLWYPITLIRSEDQPAYYIDDELTYGENSNSLSTFELPEAIRDAAMACDSIVTTKVMLAANVEFVIDQVAQRIVFTANPFLDARWPSFEEGGEEKIRVYLLSANTDARYIQNLWGVAAGFIGSSSEANKSLVNAILDASVSGSARRQLLEALSIITDIPLARGDETVELIDSDSGGTVIVTDKNVYRFVNDATVLVAEGDALLAGQEITDGLRFASLNRGSIPSWLTSLTLDASLLWQGIGGALTFVDAELPLTVVGEVSGFTKVTFPITGDVGDVADFFTEMHTRGVAATKAFANYLDIRENPLTQPEAANLPTTVNPLRLLVANVLRSNTLLSQIREDQMGPNNLGFGALATLRSILSPHEFVLTIIA